MVAIFFWRSKQKIALIFAFSLVSLCSLPFAPPGYMKGMLTIQNTNEGTADIRRHYWTLSRRCFLDPQNTLTGVGLQNTPYWMNRYETPDDLRKYPSASGRATHSIYFQLLPDLGIWGILVVGSLLFVSITNTHSIGKSLGKLIPKARLAIKAQRGDDEVFKTVNQSAETGVGIEIEGGRDTIFLLRRIIAEARYIRAVATGINVSFVAVLAAGAFIDILYYPHIWILFGLSGLIGIYGKRVILLSYSIIELLPPIHSTPVSEN